MLFQVFINILYFVNSHFAGYHCFEGLTKNKKQFPKLNICFCFSSLQKRPFKCSDFTEMLGSIGPEAGTGHCSCVLSFCFTTVFC